MITTILLIIGIVVMAVGLLIYGAWDYDRCPKCKRHAKEVFCYGPVLKTECNTCDPERKTRKLIKTLYGW